MAESTLGHVVEPVMLGRIQQTDSVKPRFTDITVHRSLSSLPPLPVASSTLKNVCSATCRNLISCLRNKVMAPTIICVRHAQGYHNLSFENQQLPDPALTPFGESQCASLSERIPFHSSIDLLVCSPLRRTINTTLLAFQPVIDRGIVPVIALPEAQETSDLPCDTGSAPSALREEFRDQPVDFSRLTDGWNSKTGRWAPTEDAIKARALEVRQWLKARPEEVIVLVSHGGFLHWFTEDWSGFDTAAGEHTVSLTWVPREEGGAEEVWSGTGWRNAEFRTFRFREDGSDSLVETAESRTARRGRERALRGLEKDQLTDLVEKAGESVGKPVEAKVRA